MNERKNVSSRGNEVVHTIENHDNMMIYAGLKCYGISQQRSLVASDVRRKCRTARRKRFLFFFQSSGVCLNGAALVRLDEGFHSLALAALLPKMRNANRAAHWIHRTIQSGGDRSDTAVLDDQMKSSIISPQNALMCWVCVDARQKPCLAVWK